MYLYPYNPLWKDYFALEEALLRQHINSDIEIFHVGSTAVDGLVAKNCIDILGVVQSIGEFDMHAGPLPAVGYTNRGEYGIKGRRYFVGERIEPSYKIHLHVFEKGHAQIQRHRNFVALMRADPKRVQALNNFKRLLSEQFSHNKGAYQQAKAPFYTQLLG
ncbi:GrpB family protein [Saccharophagus degradans]|uniref:GrpB family protein n=1 Tax=Saccharophagus degradans TaxID=86304 RepID=UPI001C09F2DD|nr:GrpB family protein [Saccharophagus degradans]MBU2984620.1 GrpB family protein [Saccharophagus degradans]